VLKLASRLFDRGYAVDIQAVNQAAHQGHPSQLVKLPSYPWNHSTRYWAEPRVHMDYRLRKWPRHALLGAPVKFSNALEPRWRNWIRLAELPWLRDHRVQSLVSLAFHISFCAMTCVSCFVRKVDLDLENCRLAPQNISRSHKLYFASSY
jgi:acyl transferase domain-containing protein